MSLPAITKCQNVCCESEISLFFLLLFSSRGLTIGRTTAMLVQLKTEAIVMIVFKRVRVLFLKLRSAERALRVPFFPLADHLRL